MESSSVITTQREVEHERAEKMEAELVIKTEERIEWRIPCVRNFSQRSSLLGAKRRKGKRREGKARPLSPPHGKEEGTWKEV